MARMVADLGRGTLTRATTTPPLSVRSCLVFWAGQAGWVSSDHHFEDLAGINSRDPPILDGICRCLVFRADYVGGECALGQPSQPRWMPDEVKRGWLIQHSNIKPPRICIYLDFQFKSPHPYFLGTLWPYIAQETRIIHMERTESKRTARRR